MSSKSALAELRAELEEREQAVVKAETKLKEAKDELTRFKAEAATALGLPRPGERGEKMRSVCARRKVVRGMLSAGKSEVEIAEFLAVPVELVSADVMVIRKSRERSQGLTGEASGSDDAGDDDDGGDESGDGPSRGWKRNKVMELFLEGKSRAEIADELEIEKSAVNSHITALRKKGLLPSAEEGDVLAEEPGGSEDGDYEGDSIETLRADVQRQQGGQRTKRAVLATTGRDGHEHKVEVDRMGDGLTTLDGTGHQHMVHRFVVGRVKDHTHDLKTAGVVS